MSLDSHVYTTYMHLSVSVMKRLAVIADVEHLHSADINPLPQMSIIMSGIKNDNYSQLFHVQNRSIFQFQHPSTRQSTAHVYECVCCVVITFEMK